MKITLQNDNYDTKLESVDWRSSAAILGLLQYLVLCQYFGHKKSNFFMLHF